MGKVRSLLELGVFHLGPLLFHIEMGHLQLAATLPVNFYRFCLIALARFHLGGFFLGDLKQRVAPFA